MRIALHATIGVGVILVATGGWTVRAFDSDQFCKAVTQVVRASAGDVGTWINRTTRNDGVEIFCNRKLVHFKRHSNTSASTLQSGWKEAQTEAWSSAYCQKPMWREAVDNGWIISATVSTVTGERIWLACQKGGTAFNRVIP